MSPSSPWFAFPQEIDGLDQQRLSKFLRRALSFAIEMASGVAAMRKVGSRLERPLAVNASGDLLAEGARFNEAILRLSQTTFVPKGIYRFRSHDAANRHAEDCLVQGMALLAATRMKNG